MNDRQLAVLKKLTEIRKSDQLTTKHLEEMMETDFKLESAGSSSPTVTSEAIDSWVRFEQGVPLDEQDMFRLESIILLNGARPSFDIQGGSYATLPSLWQDLNDRRTLIEPLIRGIGRVELTGHPQRTLAGTAFVCGDRRLVTNRHVAQLFITGVGAGAQLQFIPGITTSVDLKEEVGSSASLELKVTAPVLILEEWDIAVLEVEELPSGVRPLPLAAVAPANLADRMAAVVGYPSFDPMENLVEQIQIFRSLFDKKRLQPGRLKGIKLAQSFGREVQALAHDCTTLGGNSGSVVIDIATATVVGIHFTGQPLIANYAVPTWALTGDPRIHAAGVNL